MSLQNSRDMVDRSLEPFGAVGAEGEMKPWEQIAQYGLVLRTLSEPFHRKSANGVGGVEQLSHLAGVGALWAL
mgnify:CR=1 FL=1